MNSSRAEHLIYNIENYLIRLNSVYDRALQLVNSVFHLGIHEENVTHRVIVSNLKVSHRPEIQSSLKRIRKYLDFHAQARHTILHKHSWMEKDLRRLEFIYSIDAALLKDNPRLTEFRRNYLVDYIKAKKKEFSSINSDLAKLIQELYHLLVPEYENQMKRIWKDIYVSTPAQPA